MTNLPEVFTAIFVTTAAVSLMFGAYILRIKQQAQENMLFFATTIALVFWAMGLGMALSAPSELVSVLWRRIAAIGWGTFFSLLLHFILVTTGKNIKKIRLWLYPALYIPAIINLLVFAVPAGLNPTPFVMVATLMGWTNVAENNAWDIWYMVYYLAVMVTGLVVLWRWRVKATDSLIKNQSRIMLGTFIAALVMGTVTDMLGNILLPVRIPQMGPVWILIPITAIYFTIRRYGFFNHTQISSNEEILSASARKKLYQYITVSLVFGSVFIFFTQYVFNPNGKLGLTLALSLGLLLAGAGIHMVNRLKLSNRQKDFVNILGLALSIPIVTLCYLEFGSNTVWAFPFLLVIVALVFNKRVVLRTVAFLSMLTQVVVWILSPQAPVMIDDIAYASRVGIFAIGIGLALYVNKIYISRLKQNADQIRLQSLVSDISADFVTANQENIEEKTAALLAKTGVFFETDRAYACFFDRKNGVGKPAYMWCADGVPEPTCKSVGPAGAAPWWMNDIFDRQVVQINDYARLAAETGEMPRIGVMCRSMLAIPVMNKQKVLGFLNFENVKTSKTWQDEHIGLLKVLANTLADAKTKTEAEKEINHMAYFDHLTGLPNRQLFKDRLSQAILAAGRTGRRLGVVFLDLDSFKSVNDTLGHERGDELLKIIADRLKGSIRTSDTVSRFGGDEFLLLINNLNEIDGFVKVVKNIMAQFVQPFELKGQEFYITASAGIAMYPADGIDSDKLIKNADIAMYNAKEAGKNQYVMCSREMKETVSGNVALTTSLYRALERGELTLHYQPQVCLQTRRIIGVEALLRWNSPEHGSVSPVKFIPLAEQTGLINPIGEWVLREACRQNKAWQDVGLPAVRVAVNLSVVQLRSPRLKDIVQEALEETGLDPAYLELEITESAATREADYILALLIQLKSLGVTLSIDDFGTEYSSLSRLKMLPVDRIKMDMQFVRGIEESEKDKAITKVIINLAKNLGLKVIAEGVETETQLDFLYQKMCDEVQGFYYFKPMSADQLENVLREDMIIEESSGRASS